MNPNLKLLRNKWLPVLKQSKISCDQLVKFREDIDQFKKENTNWKNKGEYKPEIAA